MLIVGIQNTKGGATKSTTSVNVARAFQKAGLSVALAETDPQGTLREWAADNPKADNDQPPVIELRERADILSVRQHPRLAETDLLIIDGVANGFREFAAVAKVADLVLIVTQPSPADIKPIGELVDLLEGKPVQAALLMTRTRKRDDLVDQVREALAGFPYPVLNSTIRDLKGFRTTFGTGETVFEYSDYKPAQSDVVAVVEELWAIMELGE